MKITPSKIIITALLSSSSIVISLVLLPRDNVLSLQDSTDNQTAIVNKVDKKPENEVLLKTVEPKNVKPKTVQKNLIKSEKKSLPSSVSAKVVNDYDYDGNLTLPEDIEGLLDVVFTPIIDSTTGSAVVALQAMADDDPEALDKISGAFLDKLQRVDDLEERENLSSLLAFFPSEQVTQYSFELLSSEIVNDRALGYDLLSQSNDVDPVNLLQKVWDESDSVLAEGVIDAIAERSVGLVERKYTAEQKDKLSDALNSVYSSHEEPIIQAKALTQLTRLGDDKLVKPMVESALYSSEYNVRAAAIYAITEKKYYSQSNKNKLFSLLASEETDNNTLHIATDALSYGFELQESEKQQLLELKKDLDNQYLGI